MLRLRQKHSRNLDEDPVLVNADKLVAAQSVRTAVISSAITIICFNVIWAYTASLSGKFFPWMSILQGAIVGKAVQKYGHGFDWRFPVVAGVAAWIGAFSGNLFIALMFTAAETGAISGSWWQVLKGFLTNTVSVVDVIYAFFAVAIAAYYSRRPLNRHEVFALRKQAEQKHDKK